MNTLDTYKKEKREELANFAIIKEGIERLNFDPELKGLFDFLDSLIDQTIALCQEEVVPEGKKVCGCEEDPEGFGYHGKDCDFAPYGFNDCRAKVLDAFSRLKGANHGEVVELQCEPKGS